MNNLSQLTDEQLQQELQKRMEKKKQKEKPKQLENPDFSRLREYCQEYIDHLDKNGYEDDDIQHYIYEEALQAIFGRDVFGWINKQI